MPFFTIPQILISVHYTDLLPHHALQTKPVLVLIKMGEQSWRITINRQLQPARIFLKHQIILYLKFMPECNIAMKTNVFVTNSIFTEEGST